MDVCLQYSPLWGGLPHPNGPAPSSPPVGRRPPPPCQAPPPPNPLCTWLLFGLAGGLTQPHCSEQSADWPGPVGRGMISIGKGGIDFTCLPQAGKGEEWAPTWAKGVTIMSSPCLWGERTSERAAREMSRVVPSNSFCPHYALR